MIRNAAAMVREFHEVYGAAIRTEPVADPPESDLRTRLLDEEATEYDMAAARENIVEMADALADILYVTYGAALTHGIDLDAALAAGVKPRHRDGHFKVGRYYTAVHHRDIAAVTAALVDIAHVAESLAFLHGIDLDAVLAEVHRSNLSKLGEDGRPIVREDGKVLKGPNYSRPNIAAVLDGAVTR